MKELTNGQTSGLEVTVAPGSLLEAIARVAADPRTNIEAMERLLALQMQLLADQRQAAYFAALARVAAKLMPIVRSKPGHFGKYAPLEDIDAVIRPILAEEGLAQSFDSIGLPNKEMRITGRLTHADGHIDTRTIDLPIDNSGGKNSAQAVISTVSYGRRALTEMFFNIVKRGEDDDGQGGAQRITEQQALDLEALIAEVGASRAGYLKWLGVANVSDILDKDHKKAVQGLEEKRRKQK